MINFQNDFLRVLVILALGLAALGGIVGCDDQKIPGKISLTPDMLINEVAKGDASMLIDEQGSSEGLPSHPCATRWSIDVPVGEPDWYLPANVVIDLKREYVLTHIYLFDGDGPGGEYKINYGVPFKWTALLKDSLTRSNQWIDHRIDEKRTRYLQISRLNDSDLREIILYGYSVDSESEPPVYNSSMIDRQLITLDQAIGVNTHYLDPFERVKVAGIVREYHNWILNEGGFTSNYPGYPSNAIEWSPSNSDQKENLPVKAWDPKSRNGFDFDAYYKRLTEAGITVFPCIQGTVPWVSGEPNTKSRHKPLLEGKDPMDPLSYVEHSDFMFQYAARYGNTKVDEDLLKVAPGQTKRSGLNYIRYYENWNEPDGWWGGRRDYFTPYEYAAMSSADYDGHESRIGKDKGIKNADPNARLVMSGIAIPNVDYIRAMYFWFQHNRSDRRFVFDVISVHHYCNAKGSQAVMTKGISPEADGLKSIIRKISDFRDEFVPDREVWVTEFGWDTNPATPQSAASQELQGQWLVRAYLECLAAGSDRVMMYMLRDVDPKSHIQFSSSGLIGPLGNFSPKPSWFYVSTLRSQLSGLVFEKELTSPDDLVRIYRFKSIEGQKSLLVIWCTEDGKVVKDFHLEATTNTTKATVVRLANEAPEGIVQELNLDDATLRLDISASPVFVTFEGDSPE